MNGTIWPSPSYNAVVLELRNDQNYKFKIYVFNKHNLFLKSGLCCRQSFWSQSHNMYEKCSQKTQNNNPNFMSKIDLRQAFKAFASFGREEDFQTNRIRRYGLSPQNPTWLWHCFHRSQSKHANREREGAMYSKWQRQLIGSTLILQITNEWPHSQCALFPCL